MVRRGAVGKVKAGDRIGRYWGGWCRADIGCYRLATKRCGGAHTGRKGSKLRLYLLSEGDSTDAPPREVTLTRDRVDLSDQQANASIVSGIDGLRRA